MEPQIIRGRPGWPKTYTRVLTTLPGTAYGSGPHTTRPADSRFSPSMDKCLATLRQHGVVGRNSWPVGCRVRGIAAAAPAPPMPRLQGHRASQRGLLRVRVPQLQPLRWRQPPAPPGRADGAGRCPAAAPRERARGRLTCGRFLCCQGCDRAHCRCTELRQQLPRICCRTKPS